MPGYVELAQMLMERGAEMVLAGGPEDGWPPRIVMPSRNAGAGI